MDFFCQNAPEIAGKYSISESRTILVWVMPSVRVFYKVNLCRREGSAELCATEASKRCPLGRRGMFRSRGLEIERFPLIEMHNRNRGHAIAKPSAIQIRPIRADIVRNLLPVGLYLSSRAISEAVRTEPIRQKTWAESAQPHPHRPTNHRVSMCYIRNYAHTHSHEPCVSTTLALVIKIVIGENFMRGGVFMG